MPIYQNVHIMFDIRIVVILVFEEMLELQDTKVQIIMECNKEWNVVVVRKFSR